MYTCNWYEQCIVNSVCVLLGTFDVPTCYGSARK